MNRPHVLSLPVTPRASLPRHWLVSLLLILALPLMAAAESLPVVSVSVLQYGTAHWELDHIQHRGLDREQGYRLELRLVANLPASRLAVTSGAVHGAVADLLWVQSRFQDGTPYTYLPFSTQIGDILVAENSTIRTVADLAGKRIGVAGGPDSKGWILLQQVASQQGLDLAASAEVQYAAPPLLSQALKRGQLDVIVTYWHFAARLRGEGGWRSAFGMADLLTALGLKAKLPVLGYVFPAGWASGHRPLLDRFAASVRRAKAELADYPAHWQRLRPLMRSSDDGAFTALRAGFLDGTPEPLTGQRIADLHRLLVLTGADPDKLMADALFFREEP